MEKSLASYLKKLRRACQESGRDSDSVAIVFVTKYLDVREFPAFLRLAKQFDMDPLLIGENRVQEAEKKVKHIKEVDPSLRDDFKFIMVGTLQKNKINKAISIFDEIHSVDSIMLARALDKRLKREGKVMPVFLQVNISGEKAKQGFKPEKVNQALAEMRQCNNLTIEGLMTIAPYVSNPEKVRPIFRKLRQLADKYHLLTSMGMSNDWQVAVEEGSDVLRIGSRIFSP